MPYELEPPANFLQILQRVWWRLDRALDEPAIRLSVLRGGLDALLVGTTTIVDHHALRPDVDSTRHNRYWYEAFNGVVMRMALLSLVLGAIE